MSKRRAYISGPMTGMPSHNFPAFNAAAERLRKAGWEPVNPANNFGGRVDLPREEYMRMDVSLMASCDAIALLPGWRESRGARVEYLVAREIGLDALDAQTLLTLADAPGAAVLLAPVTSESVVHEAYRITGGQRRDDYGHPREDFAKTAAMWNGILADKLRDGAVVTAMDIPLCMIAVKLARQAHRHKRDNLVDIAGYARTAAMVAGDE